MRSPACSRREISKGCLSRREWPSRSSAWQRPYPARAPARSIRSSNERSNQNMQPKIAPLALVVLLMACKGETQLFHHGGDPLPPDPAPQASDLTAAQLLAKYVAARGGDQKLKAVQTVKMTGTWEADVSVPITVLIAPGRYMRRIAQG